MFRVVVVQVRVGSDPMAAHERECFARRLSGERVLIDVRNARDALPSPEWLLGADALVIGGSGSFGLADAPSRAWLDGFRSLVDLALARDLPGFAICFGHQLLGHHLGAEVRSEPERAEVGTISLELTDSGARDPLFSGLPRRFTSQTGHSDHVAPVPPGVEVLARNGVLESQAFRVSGTRFYSTQFHPDLSGAEARARFEAYYGARPDPGIQALLSRFCPEEDDAQVLLRRFVDLALHGEAAPAPSRQRPRAA